MRIDLDLNLKGNICPMNVINAKAAIKKLESGQTMRVIIDDPTGYEDVPKALKREGHKIISLKKLNDKDFEIIVQKK